MAIHVHVEIVHEDEEDLSIHSKRKTHDFSCRTFLGFAHTFKPTATKAPSVG